MDELYSFQENQYFIDGVVERTYGGGDAEWKVVESYLEAVVISIIL